MKFVREILHVQGLKYLPKSFVVCIPCEYWATSKKLNKNAANGPNVHRFVIVRITNQQLWCSIPSS